MSLSLATSFICDRWHRESLLLEDEGDIYGQTVVITGGNSGIGKAASFEFAKRGAVLVLACRNIQKAQKVVEDVKSKLPDTSISLVELDLADLESVRTCATEIRTRFPKINILVNNAGCLYTSGSLTTTKDGFEIHLGANYLGHFLLTNLLLDALKDGKPSRIVFVGSTLHLIADLDVEDLNLLNKGYFGYRNFGPYANSKLALLYYATELSRRLKNSGINVYTLCPGYVKSDAFRNENFLDSVITKIGLCAIGDSPEKACENIIFCSTSKKLANESGRMYHFNTSYDKVNKDIAEFDNEFLLRFWNISLELTNSADVLSI